MKSWMTFSILGTLVLAWSLALSEGLAGPRYPGTYAATESNNQRKLASHRGRLYLTYSRFVSGVPHVFVDISPDGRTWRTLGQVDRAQGPAALSTIAIDPSGHVHVAWTQFDRDVGRVYYSRYDTRWSRPIALSSAKAYAGYPALDADSQGRLHLLWYGIREDTVGAAHGGIYEIFHLMHDGQWSTPERISVGQPDALNPALVVDGQDRAHAVWFQSDGDAYQIIYDLWQSGSWRGPVSLTLGRRPSTRPSIAVDEDGSVHVVWTRSGEILYAAGSSDRWGAPMRVAAAGTHPSVGIWSSGVFVLGEDARGVWVSAFDGRWHPARRLGPGNYPNAFPNRSMRKDDRRRIRPYAAWSVEPGTRRVDLSPETRLVDLSPYLP